MRGDKHRQALNDFFMQTPMGSIFRFWKIQYSNALSHGPKAARGRATRATAVKLYGSDSEKHVRKVQRALQQFNAGNSERQRLADEEVENSNRLFETFAAVETILGKDRIVEGIGSLGLADTLPNAVKSAALQIRDLDADNKRLRAENAKLRNQVSECKKKLNPYYANKGNR